MSPDDHRSDGDGTRGRLPMSVDAAFAGAFFVVLLGYLLVLMNVARTYDSENRLFPLMVGIPTGLFIVAYLGRLWYLGLDTDSSSARFDDLVDDADEEVIEEVQEGDESVMPRSSELYVAGTVIAATVGVYVLGFAYALPVYIFLIVYRAKNARVALLVTVGFLAIAYVLFVVLLGTEPYRGILDLPHPFYGWF